MADEVQEHAASLPEPKGRGAAALVFAVALLALYLACLPLRDLWSPDEPGAAQVVKEMVQSGDLLKPTLLGRPVTDRPPLAFWLATLSARIGGLHEFTLRLPSALAGFLLLYAAWAWARSRLGGRAALWTVAVLGTTWLFAWHAVTVQVEMVFAAFVALSVLAFELARRQEGGLHKGWAALAGASMILAALAKGPLGIALPAAVLLLDILLRRRLRELTALGGCVLLGIVAYLVWALVQARAAGADEPLALVVRQARAPFQAGAALSETPLHGQLLVLAVMMLPWLPVLLAALPWAVLRALAAGAPHAFLLAWGIVAGVVVAAAPAAGQANLLLLCPAASLLVGAYLADRLADPGARRLLLKAGVGVAGILLAAGALAAGFMWPAVRDELHPAKVVAHFVLALEIVLFCGGAAALYVLVRGTLAQAVGIVAVTSALACLAAFGLLGPALNNPLSARDDVEWLRAQMKEGDPLVAFSKADAPPSGVLALAFYGGFRLEILGTVEEATARLGTPQGGVAVTDIPGLRALEEKAGGALNLARRMHIGAEQYAAVGSGGQAGPGGPRGGPTGGPSGGPMGGPGGGPMGRPGGGPRGPQAGPPQGGPPQG